MSGVRKIPMRRCVGCGERKEKRELVRILRDPEGKILLDPTGRANGRGAYLCRNAQCLKKAAKSRALERSLEVRIPEEIYGILEKEMEGLG